MYCISPCICDIHHCDSSGTWAGMDLISSREKLLMQPITLTKAITPPLAENILPNQGHVLRALSWIPLNHAKLRRRDRASPGQFRDLANGLFPGQIALLRRLTTLPGGRTNTGLPAPRRGTIGKLQMPLILSFRRSTARREIFDHQARGSRSRPLNRWESHQRSPHGCGRLPCHYSRSNGTNATSNSDPRALPFSHNANALPYFSTSAVPGSLDLSHFPCRKYRQLPRRRRGVSIDDG